MITNDRQFGIIRGRVERLQRLQDELLERLEKEAEDRAAVELQLRAVRAEVRRMQEELDDYEALKAGRAEVGIAERIEDLPRLLIRARVAAGLTQADLARKLDVAPQQIQRYEATNYESASLSRLTEIARVLNLKLETGVRRATTSLTRANVMRTLKGLGLDRAFLQKRLGLPTEDDETSEFMALSLISHVYSVPPERILAGDLSHLAGSLQPVAYKKPKRSSEIRAAALAGYAQYLGQLVLRAVPSIPGLLPTDPMELHAEIVSQGRGVTFKATVEAMWNAGIPVLPLDEGGGFQAGYWRHGDRDIIVINSTRRIESLWVFYLLHEAGHVSENLSEPGLVETEPGRDDAVDEEREARANEFATGVIFGGRSQELFDLALGRSQGELALMQRAVRWVARTHDVDAGALAFNVAYRLAQRGEDWWAAASGLQERHLDPWEIARSVLFERLDWSVFGPLDADLLRRALGSSANAATRTRADA